MIIRGIPVILNERSVIGKDGLNSPIYKTTKATVDNVLVTPLTENEVTEEMNLTGRRVIYRLCIPKGDSHDWTDKTVEFFGRKFRTVGDEQQYIDAMVPLEWNKQIRVEAVNG